MSVKPSQGGVTMMLEEGGGGECEAVGQVHVQGVVRDHSSSWGGVGTLLRF